MFMTQYKIILPSDYDMEIIKTRIKNNGFKTDGFESLKYKFYLITVKGENNNLYNSYSPLYLWDNTTGLNKFLFQRFYDNIIQSFGWQSVLTNVLLLNTLDNTENIKYLLEQTYNINQSFSLKDFEEKVKDSFLVKENLKYIVSYNPTECKYNVYYFTNDINKFSNLERTIYQILHISK